MIPALPRCWALPGAALLLTACAQAPDEPAALDDDTGCEDAVDWYTDADGDGFGDDATAASGCAIPAGAVAIGGDCDDSSAGVYPGAVELCDGLQSDCSAAPWSDDGLATFTPTGGVAIDVSAELTGTAAAPAAVALAEDGALMICGGVWYVHLSLQASVDITGAGAEATTLDGGGLGTVITVEDAALAAALSGLTIQGGSADTPDPIGGTDWLAGGGLYCSGSGALELQDVRFSANTADLGGGLYAGSGCQVTLQGVDFAGNTAGSGGGLYVTSVDALDIATATFTTNSATGGLGGGARLSNIGAITLSDATFSTNTAHNGGGLSMVESSITLSGALFSQNTSTNKGGGMYISSSTAALSDATFTGNTTNLAGGGLVMDDSEVTMSAMTFTDNTTSEDGGAFHSSATTVTVSDSALTGNTVPDNGGAVNLYNTTDARFVDVVFSENSAVYGGAISLTASSVAAVESADFQDNTPADVYTGSTGNTYDYDTDATFTCDSANCTVQQ